MRKVDDGEEKKRKRKKIMKFIVATNVIASRMPERQPTGTPHARANMEDCLLSDIEDNLLSDIFLFGRLSIIR